jgi:ActR/RegA family two-component response regulator
MTGSEAEALPRVLLVDDEQRLLDGLRRQLHGTFSVAMATDATAAIAQLEAATAPFEVVLSDMRMPGTDGVGLLTEVARRWPDMVRMMLTGQADLPQAAAAVNSGGIFRLLLKPSSPEDIRAALHAAVGQHRLQLAERELLEQTLSGAVAALVDTLALAAPAAFSRGQRVQRLALELAERTGADTWVVRLGALLGQLGATALPPGLDAALDGGQPLSREDLALLAEVPVRSAKLIGDLPRLERVREALRGSAPESPGLAVAARGDLLEARILRAAHDAELATSAGLPADQVLDRLGGCTEPALLAALRDALAAGTTAAPVTTLRLVALRIGMVLADDLPDAAGRLLVGRGTTVSEAMLDRLTTFRERGLLLTDTVSVVGAPRD